MYFSSSIAFLRFRYVCKQNGCRSGPVISITSVWATTREVLNRFTRYERRWRTEACRTSPALVAIGRTRCDVWVPPVNCSYRLPTYLPGYGEHYLCSGDLMLHVSCLLGLHLDHEEAKRFSEILVSSNFFRTMRCRIRKYGVLCYYRRETIKPSFLTGQWIMSYLLFGTQLKSMGLSVPQKTLRLRYEPNRLMLSIGLWRWYINIAITFWTLSIVLTSI
jgi:hypothetical protein